MRFSFLRSLLIGFCVNAAVFTLGYTLKEWLNFNDDWMMLYSGIPFFVTFRLGLGVAAWFFAQLVINVAILWSAPNILRLFIQSAIWISVNTLFFIVLDAGILRQWGIC